MKTYLAILRYHLTGLHRFSGRDSVDRFWVWAGTVVFLMFIGFSLAVVPFMAGSFARMDRFARENPELATRTAGPGHYSVSIEGHHPELMPDFGPFIGLTIALTIVAMLLLGASLVRRLHDSGRSGRWALLPLPFLLGGMWGMKLLFGNMAAEPDLRVFALLFLNNVIYLGTIALLMLFTMLRGTPGDNRYGPPPA